MTSFFRGSDQKQALCPDFGYGRGPGSPTVVVVRSFAIAIEQGEVVEVDGKKRTFRFGHEVAILDPRSRVDPGTGGHGFGATAINDEFGDRHLATFGRPVRQEVGFDAFAAFCRRAAFLGEDLGSQQLVEDVTKAGLVFQQFQRDLQF